VPSQVCKQFGCGDITWEVLDTLSINDLLWDARVQDVDEGINSPRYPIVAPGEGPTRLRQDPEQPLPLCHPIFLNSANNICYPLLANNGPNRRNLFILELGLEDGDALDETPEPPNEMYTLFNSDFWDEWAGAEDAPEE